MLSSSSAESAADFKSKSLPVGKENDHFVLPSLSSVARGSVSSMENLSNIHHFKTGSPTASIKMKDNGDSVPRVKRPYNKKRVPPPDEFAEKPPPKKRGRKSKKELMLLNKKSEITELINSPMVTNTKVTKSRKKPPPVGEDPLKLPVKPPRKNASASKSKKNQHSNMGPSVFDKKMLAGPHLTMKQVLEYILTDHSYCVPPDPLPAVGSNHQMIRYILGPKDGAKATPISLTSSASLIDPGDRPSILGGYPVSRVAGQLVLTPPPGPPSKLEHLLKRRDHSPVGLIGTGSRLVRGTADYYRDECDGEIDVESVEPEPEKRVAYDVQVAKDLMNECEKYVEFARASDTGDDWERKVLRTGWTKSQTALYDKVIGILHAERLSRLAYESAGDTEPVLRRASLDKTATRVRRVFAEYLWDTKLTQWLHGVLTESLNFHYLAIYLDVLQSLKSLCPQLVSRMLKLSVGVPLQKAFDREDEMASLLLPYLDPLPSDEIKVEVEATATDRENNEEFIGPADYCTQDKVEPLEPVQDASNLPAKDDVDIFLPERSVVPQMKDAMSHLQSAKNAEALKALLDRQWDPFAPLLCQRLKKLSANPVFLVISPGAVFPKLSLHRRLKQYYRMFSRIGKVVKVSPGISKSLDYTSVSSYLERTLYIAKEKIKHTRLFYPDRPLYLVGWGSGCILTARLSTMAGPVDGIISLAFPLHSLKEIQEDVLKSYSGIKHPILFVIGGLASNNSLTDMELFRRRLACETSLVVIGSGNENLYVARDCREKLYVTQSYVDKTVMDEMAYFVNLHSKHNQIIATNIAMKPHQFPKSQANGEGSHKKSNSMPRGKKRRSSCSSGADIDISNPAFNESPTSMMPPKHFIKNEYDSPKPMSSYDYTSDWQQSIPSNKSSNKRKAYYRSDSTSTSPVASAGCITASKLVQQGPNAKRRISKPSGPNQRAPLLTPPQSQHQLFIGKSQESRSSESLGLPKNSRNPESKIVGDMRGPHAHPLIWNQNDGLLGSSVGGIGSNTPSPSTEKGGRKKSAAKSRGQKRPRSPVVSPSFAIASAINAVSAPPLGHTLNPTPTSSLDVHKFVLKHQQRVKELEQSQSQSPQTSQLYKLLSPTSSSESAPTVSKAELLPPSTFGEPRTALISKQNLMSGMSLPLISLPPAIAPPSTQGNLAAMFVTSAVSSGVPLPFAPSASVPTTATVLVTSAAASPSSSGYPVAVVSNAPIPSSTGTTESQLIYHKPNTSVMTSLPPYNFNNIVQLPTGASQALQLLTNFHAAPSIFLRKAEDVPMGPTSSSSILESKPPSANLTKEVPLIPISTSTSLPGFSSPPENTTQIQATPPVPAGSLDSVAVSTAEERHQENNQPTQEGQEAKESTLQVTENENEEAACDQPKLEEITDPEPEPMQEESDGEEMSSLKISSTFSVCPTSGQRVIPSASGASMSNPDVLQGGTSAEGLGSTAPTESAGSTVADLTTASKSETDSTRQPEPAEELNKSESEIIPELEKEIEPVESKDYPAAEIPVAPIDESPKEGVNPPSADQNAEKLQGKCNEIQEPSMEETNEPTAAQATPEEDVKPASDCSADAGQTKQLETEVPLLSGSAEDAKTEPVESEECPSSSGSIKAKPEGSQINTPAKILMPDARTTPASASYQSKPKEKGQPAAASRGKKAGKKSKKSYNLRSKTSP